MGSKLSATLHQQHQQMTAAATEAAANGRRFVNVDKILTARYVTNNKPMISLILKGKVLNIIVGPTFFSASWIVCLRYLKSLMARQTPTRLKFREQQISLLLGKEKKVCKFLHCFNLFLSCNPLIVGRSLLNFNLLSWQIYLRNETTKGQLPE